MPRLTAVLIAGMLLCVPAASGQVIPKAPLPNVQTRPDAGRSTFDPHAPLSAEHVMPVLGSRCSGGASIGPRTLAGRACGSRSSLGLPLRAR